MGTGTSNKIVINTTVDGMTVMMDSILKKLGIANIYTNTGLMAASIALEFKHMLEEKEKDSLPAGVILYAHEGGSMGHVAYTNEKEFVRAFEKSVKDGFDPQRMFPYVRTGSNDITDRLFAIMEEAYGERYDVYILTPDNAALVLGDSTVAIRP